MFRQYQYQYHIVSLVSAADINLVDESVENSKSLSCSGTDIFQGNKKCKVRKSNGLNCDLFLVSYHQVINCNSFFFLRRNVKLDIKNLSQKCTLAQNARYGTKG